MLFISMWHTSCSQLRLLPPLSNVLYFSLCRTRWNGTSDWQIHSHKNSELSQWPQELFFTFAQIDTSTIQQLSIKPLSIVRRSEVWKIHLYISPNVSNPALFYMATLPVHLHNCRPGQRKPWVIFLSSSLLVGRQQQGILQNHPASI